MELYKSDSTYGAFIYPRKSLDYEGYLVPAQWFADQQAIQTDPAWGGLMTGYGFYSGNYTATRACAAPEWQAVFNGQKTAEEAVDASSPAIRPHSTRSTSPRVPRTKPSTGWTRDPYHAPSRAAMTHRLPAAQVSVAAWASSCSRSRRSCS